MTVQHSFLCQSDRFYSIHQADLRASVYKAVVSDGQTWKPEQKTEALKLAETSSLGQLAADLVIDYLDHLHLRQTLCVLAPESGLVSSFLVRKEAKRISSFV